MVHSLSDDCFRQRDCSSICWFSDSSNLLSLYISLLLISPASIVVGFLLWFLTASSCLFWHVQVFNNNLFFEWTELFPQDRQKYLFFRQLESQLYGQSWWETLVMSSPTWWKPKHCEIVIELKALHLHEEFSFAISSLETIVSCDIFCCCMRFAKGWLSMRGDK